MASVRQTAIDTIVSNLSNITTANNYTYDVGADRVYRQADNPAMMPTPSIIIVQGEENIDRQYSDLYECALEVIVGFVDNYNGTDPEGQGNLFLADIQKAIGREFVIIATPYGGSEAGTSTVQLTEQSNTVTISSSLPGYILGEIVFEMRYRRHIIDPNRV